MSLFYIVVVVVGCGTADFPLCCKTAGNLAKEKLVLIVSPLKVSSRLIKKMKLNRYETVFYQVTKYGQCHDKTTLWTILTRRLKVCRNDIKLSTIDYNVLCAT